MKVSGPVSSIILNTACFSATLSCRAGCTNNGHKVSRTDLYSPVCAIAISLRRRCEDCPGDRTHRVVSRVICDAYSDLSPQRRYLFGEKILGAGQPRHENKMCRMCCHDAV